MKIIFRTIRSLAKLFLQATTPPPRPPGPSNTYILRLCGLRWLAHITSHASVPLSSGPKLTCLTVTLEQPFSAVYKAGARDVTKASSLLLTNNIQQAAKCSPRSCYSKEISNFPHKLAYFAMNEIIFWIISDAEFMCFKEVKMEIDKNLRVPPAE